ncbi:MAG: DUF4292 domain-containing protein [Rhodothermaceae bacterium]|nr:DUF4292 domain-containing protein [Rhodothermaceae bacterium]MYF64186.1 DUF4292 domain-containing protein [Rhodothermaceae bacterium]MYI84863.1 DUF4292 domain-containing protein [Rhodothermaceae bacterium]
MRKIALICALVVAGCAGTRTSVEAPANVPDLYEAAAVLDSIWAHPVPTSIKAQVQLSMDTPIHSGTMMADISHRRGDSLLMAFTVRGLGIEVGRALVTQDSIFFYDRLAQSLHTADSNYPAIPAIFTVQDAIENLLGLIRPAHQSHTQLEQILDRLVLTDTLQNKAYTVDPALWRIIHAEQRDSSDTLTESLYFSDFFTVGEMQFPRRVVYRNPAADINAILHYRSIQINEPIVSMSLNLPSGVSRVSLPER